MSIYVCAVCVGFLQNTMIGLLVPCSTVAMLSVQLVIIMCS